MTPDRNLDKPNKPRLEAPLVYKQIEEVTKYIENTGNPALVESLQEINDQLALFLRGETIVTPPESGSQKAAYYHPETYDDFLRGRNASAIRYFQLYEYIFSNQQEVPVGKENAVAQIGITRAWLGDYDNKYGGGRSTIKQLKAVREAFYDDFPEQIESTTRDIGQHELKLERLQDAAENLGIFVTESLSIELHSVYFDPNKNKIFFDKTAQLTVNKQLNGRTRLEVKTLRKVGGAGHYQYIIDEGVSYDITDARGFSQLRGLPKIVDTAIEVYAPGTR